MNSLIGRLLRKRGIDDVEKLSAEEKATVENYERILSKRELTVADLREFARFQVDKIEGVWRDQNVEQSRKAELIPYHTVYKTLLQAIEAPEAERKALESVLLQQIS